MVIDLAPESKGNKDTTCNNEGNKGTFIQLREGEIEFEDGSTGTFGK